MFDTSSRLHVMLASLSIILLCSHILPIPMLSVTAHLLDLGQPCLPKAASYFATADLLTTAVRNRMPFLTY